MTKTEVVQSVDPLVQWQEFDLEAVRKRREDLVLQGSSRAKKTSTKTPRTPKPPDDLMARLMKLSMDATGQNEQRKT